MSLFSIFTHQRSTENQDRGARDASARPAGQHATQGAILVALSGEAFDAEVMALACTMARARRINAVHAVYAVEVPRAFAVTDELPEAQEKAQAAFHTATEEAAAFGIELVTEYVQSRNSADCLVRVACSDRYALLVMGLPGAEGDAAVDPTEKVDEVLRSAPCRVWVVRGASLAA